MIAPSWEEMKASSGKEKRFFLIDLQMKPEGLLELEVCLLVCINNWISNAWLPLVFGGNGSLPSSLCFLGGGLGYIIKYEEL